MTPTVEEVRAALREVEDPELPVSLVDLGLVRGIDVAGGEVTVRLTYTSVGCPCTDLIREDVEERLRRLPGVTGVRVKEVDERWTRGDLSPEGRRVLAAYAVL